MGVEILKAITTSFLALIPKKDNPQLVEEYISICSIESLYMIHAKLLSNIFKKVMSSLIFKPQSTFLAQRHMFDGIVVLNEVVDYSKRFNKKRLLLKSNFKKPLTRSLGSISVLF